MDLDFSDFNFDAMPEGDDAAAWVTWFGNALAALFKLVSQLFAKLTGGNEDAGNDA